jgi:hypothetical protein
VNETRVFRERHAVTGSGIVAFTSEEVGDLSDHHAVAAHFEWRSPVAEHRLWAGAPADTRCAPMPRGSTTVRLCSHPPQRVETLTLSWCDGGFDPGQCSGMAPEPRRCIQIADPASDDPAGFDDYLCYGE